MQPGEAETAYALVAQNDYGLYIWGSYGIALIGLAGILVWSILRTRVLERRAADQRRPSPSEEDFR